MVKKFMVATFATLLLAGTAIAEEGTNDSSSSSSSSSSTSSSSSSSSSQRREEKLRRENTNRHQNGRSEESRALNVVCIQSAVRKREDAHIAALQAFFNAKIAAHTIFRDALVNAWGLSTGDARKAARQAAGQAYESAVQSARAALNAARKQAKSVFKTERRGCNAPTETEPDPSATPGV